MSSVSRAFINALVGRSLSNMVKREWTEIESQAHKMWAEGTSDEEPTKDEIIELLKKENWLAKDIDVWMDTMMGFWRWTCNIEAV